jgi:hypothetical protein
MKIYHSIHFNVKWWYFKPFYPCLLTSASRDALLLPLNWRSSAGGLDRSVARSRPAGPSSSTTPRRPPRKDGAVRPAAHFTTSVAPASSAAATIAVHPSPQPPQYRGRGHGQQPCTLLRPVVVCACCQAWFYSVKVLCYSPLDSLHLFYQEFGQHRSSGFGRRRGIGEC